MQVEPFGKYYLLDRIASGGMAEVFRAKSRGVEGFGKYVAIKRILPQLAENYEFITMLIDEAKIAARLNHTNIAQIYDLGKVHSLYFIAMELVSGVALNKLLNTCNRKGTWLQPADILYIAIEALKGLHYAHTLTDAEGHPLNIVHRDVSPQNILISFEGAVKIVDFGIAKAVGRAGETRGGVIKGKFAYMSPEQAQGRRIDHRSDIYSSGILLYEMLTKRPLFERDSDIQTLVKVQEGMVPRFEDVGCKVPQPLADIIYRALARDNADRYQEAAQFQTDLQNFLYGFRRGYTGDELKAFMQETFVEEIETERETMRQCERMMKEVEEGAEPWREEPTLESPVGKTPPPGAASTGVSTSVEGSAEAQPLGAVPITGELRQITTTRRVVLGASFALSALVLLLVGAGAAWYLITRGGGVVEGGGGPAAGLPAEARDARPLEPPPGRAVTPGRGEEPPPEVETGSITIRSTPAGAKVYVQGELRGQTPLTLEHLATGKLHDIQLKKPGYHTWHEQVFLKGPEGMVVEPKLAVARKAYGMLDLNSEPWANIYVDGRKIGRFTPAKNIRLTAGRHRIRLVNPGLGIERTITVTIVEGKKITKVVKLR